jgi:carboxypeptidase T
VPDIKARKLKMIKNRPALKNLTMVMVALAALAPARPTGAEAADPGDGWLGPYPPLSVVYGEIQALAADHPDLVSLSVIGMSVQKRQIYAIHVGRKDGRERPEALITANIHAGEVLSSRVAMGVARRLCEDDGKHPWITALLDQTDLWIVPVINPDGYHRVISTGGKGAEMGTRKNAGGVDLNRNYPLAPGAKSSHPLAGNRRPKSQYYMGQKELSEPETKAVADFVEKHDFYISINGHTVAGKFLYPHGFTREPARHTEEFIRVGEAFIERQPHKKYAVQKSFSWYPTLGDMDDFLYMQHGVMSFTVEHGTVGYNLKYALSHPRIFWVMNPHDAQRWVENDTEAILAAVEKALEITGGEPYPAPVDTPVSGK